MFFKLIIFFVKYNFTMKSNHSYQINIVDSTNTSKSYVSTVLGINKIKMAFQRYVASFDPHFLFKKLIIWYWYIYIYNHSFNSYFFHLNTLRKWGKIWNTLFEMKQYMTHIQTRLDFCRYATIYNCNYFPVFLFTKWQLRKAKRRF